MLERMAQAEARAAELARRHRARLAAAARGSVVIARCAAQVLDIELDHAVVEVGGVGLAVHATPTTLAALRRGEQARLATALIVREDSLTLFGFADDDERELFDLLLTVSGVGPRMALATLAVLDPDTLRRALADRRPRDADPRPGDRAQGRRAAGRGAARQGRRPGAGPGRVPAPATGRRPRRDQVVEALVGLGLHREPAEQAVDAVLAAEAARRRCARPRSCERR